MVKAFSRIFRMNVTRGALVQVAFMEVTLLWLSLLPSSLKVFLQIRHTHGISTLCYWGFLFFPAKLIGSYYPFLIAYFILTCGLSFLETSANPYILTMGPEENATRRLNLAQSFNPLGSLLGMYVAMHFIQAKLNPMSTAERGTLSDEEFKLLSQSDLSILIAHYLIIRVVVLIIFLAILLPY